jgi:ABC-type sugar transport system permease subunit
VNAQLEAAVTTAQETATHPPKTRKRPRSPWTPWAFLSPYLVLTSIFFVYPFLNAVLLAFYQTNGPKSRVFVGLDNFAYLLSDPVFHRALYNTTLFASFSIFVQLPISMGLALMLHASSSRVKNVLRLLLFSPNLVGGIFVGILFGVMYAPRYGIINRTTQALFSTGLDNAWLSDPSLVMPAIILTSMWVWVGFNMVYFLAALEAVDPSLAEAARIDGASAWQTFWHVTLPSMRHVVVFVTVMSLIGSFQLFELPMAMLGTTHGFGPDNSGLTLITYLNEVAFRSGDLGLGAAVGWVVALIIFSMSLVQMRVTGGLDE